MAPGPPDPKHTWERRFDAEDYHYGTEPNDFLREHVDSLPSGPVLCLAEGEGRNAVFLAGRGFEVSSVDLTDAGVRKTRSLAIARGVSVDATTGDLAMTDLGVRRWTGIVSIFAHLPGPIRRDLHRRVVAALAPGGVLILEAYTPDQIGRGTGGPPIPELTMTLDELRNEFSGLDIIHGLETERNVVEGHGHTGLASVVQIIARRPA
jgi:SAM-dependent methyltransferase